jgi:hypothetical protein
MDVAGVLLLMMMMMMQLQDPTMFLLTVLLYGAVPSICTVQHCTNVHT